MSDQPKVWKTPIVSELQRFQPGEMVELHILSSVWHRLALSQLGRMAKMPSDSARRLGASSFIAALQLLTCKALHVVCVPKKNHIGPYNSETARISPNGRLFIPHWWRGSSPKNYSEEHLRQGFFDDGDAVDSEEGSWQSTMRKDTLGFIPKMVSFQRIIHR